MPRIEIVSSGVIYRNPFPGDRAINAFLPCVLPTSATEWLCAFRLGSAFYSPDGRVHLLRTVDAGATWTHESSTWNGNDDARPYSYTGGFLTAALD